MKMITFRSARSGSSLILRRVSQPSLSGSSASSRSRSYEPFLSMRMPVSPSGASSTS